MTCETIIHHTVESVAFFVFRQCGWWLLGTKKEILNHLDCRQQNFHFGAGERLNLVELLNVHTVEPDLFRFNQINKTIIIQIEEKCNIVFYAQMVKRKKNSNTFELHCNLCDRSSNVSEKKTFWQLNKLTFMTFVQFFFFKYFFSIFIQSRPIFHMLIQNSTFNIPYQCIECESWVYPAHQIQYDIWQRWKWWKKKLISIHSIRNAKNISFFMEIALNRCVGFIGKLRWVQRNVISSIGKHRMWCRIEL